MLVRMSHATRAFEHQAHTNIAAHRQHWRNTWHTRKDLSRRLRRLRGLLDHMDSERRRSLQRVDVENFFWALHLLDPNDIKAGIQLD